MAVRADDADLEPADAYATLKVPAMLLRRVEALLEANDWGFRTKAEFVATAIREGLQKYERPRRKA